MTVPRATLEQLEASLRAQAAPGPMSPATAREVADSYRRAASVYVLFRDERGEPSVLLIKRAEDAGRHRGEWAFPGGVAEEEDASLLATAQRELHEELGVEASLVEHWGALGPVSTRTGFVVWPFTGRLAEEARLTPCESEVADVLSVPVSALLDDGSHRTISRLRGGAIRRGDAFAYQGNVIWGATARILGQVLGAVDSNQSEIVAEGVKRSA